MKLILIIDYDIIHVRLHFYIALFVRESRIVLLIACNKIK